MASDRLHVFQKIEMSGQKMSFWTFFLFFSIFLIIWGVSKPFQKLFWEFLEFFWRWNDHFSFRNTVFRAPRHGFRRVACFRDGGSQKKVTFLGQKMSFWTFLFFVPLALARLLVKKRAQSESNSSSYDPNKVPKR